MSRSVSTRVVAEDGAQGDLPVLVGPADVAVEVHLVALGEQPRRTGGSTAPGRASAYSSVLPSWRPPPPAVVRSGRRRSRRSSASPAHDVLGVRRAVRGRRTRRSPCAGAGPARRSSSRFSAIASRRSRPSGRTGRACISSSRSKKCSRSSERTFSSFTAFARLSAEPAHDLLHGALGGVAALDRERPADAAVRADVGLDEVDGLELARLDAVEDPHDVAHPADRHGVGVAQARDLPARHRPEQPARADGRGRSARPWPGRP